MLFSPRAGVSESLTFLGACVAEVAQGRSTGNPIDRTISSIASTQGLEVVPVLIPSAVIKNRNSDDLLDFVLAVEVQIGNIPVAGRVCVGAELSRADFDVESVSICISSSADRDARYQHVRGIIVDVPTHRTFHSVFIEILPPLGGCQSVEEEGEVDVPDLLGPVIW